MILDLAKSKEILDSLSKYRIVIGVVSKETTREGQTTDIITKQTIGITNAELMFIHENGSPMRNVPSRPVLQYTIEWAQENLDEVLNECIEGVFEGWTQSQVEKHLKIFCMRMENYARDMIYQRDSRLEPNKPGTISAKGSDLPLFDTGQLARSITAELIKIDSEAL